MFRTFVTLQDASFGRSSRIITRLGQLANAAKFSRFRAAAAYVTGSGTREILAKLEGSLHDWKKIEKKWLISIDFGRSEPDALDSLTRLPNSQVRIPDAAEIIENNLIPRRCFHPKTFIFDMGGNHAGAPFGLFIGSANVSLSGLRAGVEHAASFLWSLDLTEEETRGLEAHRKELEWWDTIWAASTPLSNALLTDYRKRLPIRPTEDSTTSIVQFTTLADREVEKETGLAWANARFLWVKTLELYKNRGLGKPGNQLDLRRGTRVYFGFPADTVIRNTVLGSVAIRYKSNPFSTRSIRFGNNSMDKVNLPIPGEDGPQSYDNTVLHFERVGHKRFRVILGKAADLKRWRKLSERQGLKYEFAGGREYGFYS